MAFRDREPCRAGRIGRVLRLAKLFGPVSRTGVADPEASRPALDLERLIGRTLEEQPLVRVPPTLETRILARIEARNLSRTSGRASLRAPRGQFTAWSPVARAAFVAGAGLSAALLLIAWPWLASQAASAGAHPLVGDRIAGLRTSAGGLIAAGRLLWQLGRGVPREWLYASLAAATALYALLFGLAAAVYRAAGGAATAEVHRS